MSSVCGVACPISILYKNFVDFNEFKNHDLDLLSDVCSQKWESHLNMPNRPIYPILVREFWTYVSLLQLTQDDFMHSV